ncbi:hypothetical protein E3P99_01752 [Wallemia hederae]|uniref:Importin-7/11-like TPR repeats domain-containing protein n=1 Tax=Wallemia hederae TaxID=1540922 RepID=A0A4T0FQ48_9BASI|nr:hypothetical protein E3P99_01752 [Wallemia hederae]
MSALENLLKLSITQNASSVAGAAQELDKVLRQTDTLDALHAYSLTSDDATLALSAMLIVKNNLITYWRNVKSLQLSEAGRNRIRIRCIEYLSSTNDKTSELNAIVLSKIARIDYPRYWDSLLLDIVSSLSPELAVTDATHRLRLKRAVYALHLITKEITSIRIANKAFPGLYSSLFTFILNVYQGAYSNLNTDDDWIYLATYAFKILAKLSLHNFNRSAGDELQNTVQFTQMVLAHLPNILQYKDNNDIPQLTKLVNAITKYFKLLQQSNQGRFSAIGGIEGLIPIIYTQITNRAYESTPPKYIIHILLILKLSLADWVEHAPNKQNPNAVLTDEFALQVVDYLIRHYLPLTRADLEQWQNAPEEWVHQDNLDQWEIDPRPCAENVILGTLIKRRQVVGSYLINLLKDASQSDDIIYKEAVYRIIAKCAEYLQDDIGFEGWLDSALIPQVQMRGGDVRILRRRIAVVLSRFAGESLSPSAYTKIYTILLHCLRAGDEDNDTAVQVTAAITLAGVVDTWEFNPALFEPFLNDIMPELIRILSACELVEVKVKVLTSITCIIDQVGDRAIHYGPRLLELVPGLWEESEDDWPFRGGILSMLSRLVAALQEGSNRALGIVVPLIQASLDPSQGKAYIDMDGIELWQTTLKHAPGLDESLLSLLPLAISIYRNDLDLAEHVGPIIESYIYLSPENVVMQYSESLFSAVSAMLSYATDSIRNQMMHLMNLATIASTPSAWASALNSTGLCRDLVVKLLENNESALFLAKIMLLFSRIVIVDNDMFVQLLRMAAQSLMVDESVVLNGVLDRWWDKWDNLGDNYDRKLSASGLARLVATGHPLVLARLPSEISNVFIDVLAEIKERRLEQQEADGNTNTQATLTTHPQLNNLGDEGTSEKTRKLAIYSNDPLSSFTIPQFISHSLAHAQQNYAGGPDAFNQTYFMAADQAVIGQLVGYMNETI